METKQTEQRTAEKKIIKKTNTIKQMQTELETTKRV